MKRVILVLISLLLVLWGSGQTIDDIPFDFDCNGLLYRIIDTPSQTVELATYSQDHSFSDGRLVIPSKVKFNDTQYKVVSVGDNAFHGCNLIQSVEIGKNVKVLGVASFSHCDNLVNVHYGNIIAISDRAFSECPKLSNPDFPEELVYIGSEAFWNNQFTDVVIPDNVIEIGNEAFGRNPVLLMSKEAISVLYGDSPPPAGSIKKLSLGYSLVSIGAGAFKETLLDEVIIPPNVKIIGKDAFLSSHKIKSITCLPVTPPIIGNSTTDFEYQWDFIDREVSDDAILFINQKSLNLYKSENLQQDCWQQFQIKVR